jgi:hypothetical protein
VATAIAQKLQAKLTGNEERALKSKPTANLDAYDAYLRGLEFDRRTETLADLLEARRYLELAVKARSNVCAGLGTAGKSGG